MVLRLNVFFLISNPSVWSSTSVGMMHSLTAFLLCLSLSGFFNNTRKSSSLSTNAKSPFKSPTDSLSRASTSELPEGSGRLLRLAGAVKARRSTFAGLQCFFTNSCRSMRRRQLKVDMARGNSPLTLLSVTFSSKFFSSFSLPEPTSVRTRLEESSTRVMEWPFPKSTLMTTLSRLMLEPCSILSQDWACASWSSSEAASWTLLVSSRTRGFLLATKRKREAPLRGEPSSRDWMCASMRVGTLEKCILCQIIIARPKTFKSKANSHPTSINTPHLSSQMPLSH